MRLSVAFASVLLATGSAQAALSTFVSNPGSNSVDWTQYVQSLGSPIDLNVDFESHALGDFDGDHYAQTDGVTMTLAGSNFAVADVVLNFNNYNGSLDGNTSAAEGVADENQHVFAAYSSTGPWTLTVSFATPVSGFGLDVIDLYNPWGNRTVTLAAYTGTNGTGTMLGTASALQYNFQLYNKYFMGLASDTPNIGSVVFTNPHPFYGDGIFLDSMRMALAPVPEPGTWALTVAGLGLLGWAARRRA